MKDRPKRKVELSFTDKLVEWLGWFALVATWGLTILHYPQLPDTIPTHYNAAGQPDAYGSKNSLLALPVVATVLFVGLTILNRFPHIFNYPATITNHNALQYYTTATRLLRYLKLIVVAVFGFIVYTTIQLAQGKAEGLGVWFLPLAFCLFFVPIIFALTKSYLKASK